MSLLKKYIPLLLFFFIAGRINAQVDCSQRYKYAQELYESGQLENIPALLDSCFAIGFEGDLEIQAYTLLMQTYLFDYNRDKAMDVMHKFLTKYPEYQFPDSTPVEIKEIYSAYRVMPNWGFEISAGVTYSNIQSIQNFSVFDLNYLKSEYQPKFGINVNFNVEKFLGKSASITTGLGYKSVVYENTETDLLYGNSTWFKESSSWLTLPIKLSYFPINKNVSPYIFAGAEFGYLLNSDGNIKYTVNNTAKTIDVSLKNMRNPLQISAMGGIGLRYHIPKGFLKLWIAYNYSVNEYINKSKRYSSPDVYFNGHIDDDIKFNHYFVGFSFSKILYKINTAGKK
jgi:hypothetical protein